jgi:hypothetical protein
MEGEARAMRRTYQDLARAAEMKDLMTRAISGHATEQRRARDSRSTVLTGRRVHCR